VDIYQATGWFMSAVDWNFAVRDYIANSGREVAFEGGRQFDIAVEYGLRELCKLHPKLTLFVRRNIILKTC